MRVGIRELKAHLSEYVERARKGEPVVVTQRGKPILRLEPLVYDEAFESIPPKLKRLIEEGKATYHGPIDVRDFQALPPLVGDKTLSDLIIEERDESLRRYEWF